MKKYEKEINELKEKLIIEKLKNESIKRKLKKVLIAWEYEANQGDGIMEKHSDLFSQAKNSSEMS